VIFILNYQATLNIWKIKVSFSKRNKGLNSVGKQDIYNAFFLEVGTFLYFCHYALRHGTMAISLTNQKCPYLCLAFKELKDERRPREVLS